MATTRSVHQYVAFRCLLLLTFFLDDTQSLARIKPLPREDPFSVETSYPQRYILGSDESGVGCIAGPIVCVTCCVVNPDRMISDCRTIRDGKSLSLEECQEIHRYAEQNPDIIKYSVSQRTSQEIDEFGIFNCVQDGFRESIQSLLDDHLQIDTTTKENIVYSIVDGQRSPSFDTFTSRPWKQADSMVYTVAVAGCLARAIHAERMRDHEATLRTNETNDIIFQWDGGYPTVAHLQSLATYGPTEFHRLSCKPVMQHCRRRDALSLLFLMGPLWLATREAVHAMVRERGMLLPERGEVEAAVPTEDDWSDVDEIKEPLRRLDDADDAIFYQDDRFVEHIDDTAVTSLYAYLDSVVDKNKSVLDVGASWTSHLERFEKAPSQTIVGVGMNANELSANKILSDRVVQNLNQTPKLPFEGKTFDVVLCQLTIDYLTRPISVCKEIHRVLKDNGTFHVIFSNRLFLQKAVDNWTGRDDLEHIEIVASYLHYAGFRIIEAQDLSLRTKRGSVIGDPLYVVRGEA